MAKYVDILDDSGKGLLAFLEVPLNSLRFFLVLHDICQMLGQIRKYNDYQRKIGGSELDLVLEPDANIGTSAEQLKRFEILLQPRQTLSSLYQLVVNLTEEMKRREAEVLVNQEKIVH